ncbi:permease of the major facilitator superfamily, partial [Hortaea werneckii]
KHYRWLYTIAMTDTGLPAHSQGPLPDPEKIGLEHKETYADHEIDPTGDGNKSEAQHMTQLTEEELVWEKQLKRKIDFLIMPMCCIVYLMNYIDRNNYPAARLQGMPEDLNMTDNEYSIGLSILFVGYVTMQVPSNLLLNYCGRPSWYLGFFICAWGLVSLLSSQATNAGGMIALRFILGLVEAPFFAGVLFYLSKWYTKNELNLRMSIFYSASLLSGAFGNLIAAGILNGLGNNQLGVRAWQWLYIIEGSITIFIGLIVVFVLPDFPHTWKKLSGDLKHVANRRMALDAGETDIDQEGGMSQIHGMKLAFKDPKMYLLAIGYHCIVAASGFQNFFPTLTETLGYNRTISLLLVAPPYIFITFWSYIHSVLSDRFQKRYWFFMYPIVPVIVGSLVFMFTDGFGPRYFSFFLLIFVFAAFGTIYAWISNTIPRPPAKRASALAFINSFGNAASIWTPYTYWETQQPYYRVALGIVIGLMVVAGICATILRFWLSSENKKLERMENEDVQLSQAELKKLEKTAETEGTTVAAARTIQKGFRYML